MPILLIALRLAFPDLMPSEQERPAPQAAFMGLDDLRRAGMCDGPMTGEGLAEVDEDGATVHGGDIDRSCHAVYWRQFSH